MSQEIKKLKAEIIQIVVDFALQHQHIKSPLVIRGLELHKLQETEKEQQSPSLENLIDLILKSNGSSQYKQAAAVMIRNVWSDFEADQNSAIQDLLAIGEYTQECKQILLDFIYAFPATSTVAQTTIKMRAMKALGWTETNTGFKAPKDGFIGNCGKCGKAIFHGDARVSIEEPDDSNHWQQYCPNHDPQRKAA